MIPPPLFKHATLTLLLLGPSSPGCTTHTPTAQPSQPFMRYLGAG